MDMPKNCAECPMSWTEDGYEYVCNHTNKTSCFGSSEVEYRPEDCPIIEELVLKVNVSALTEEEIREFMEYVCEQIDFNGFKSCKICKHNDTVIIRSDVKKEFYNFVNCELDNYAVGRNMYVFRLPELSEANHNVIIIRP